MSTSYTWRSGKRKALHSLLCVCFFQISVSYRAIGIKPVMMCAQDVLVLIQNINGPLICNTLGETHINFHNITQDDGNCTIPCSVTAVVRLKNENDRCYIRSFWGKPPKPLGKEIGFFYFSQPFCCNNFRPHRYVKIQGHCDFNIYHKTNAQFGEICTSEEQCHNTSSLLRCVMNRCLCEEGYIEYYNQCVRGLPYGEECEINEQCIFIGGVCSRNKTCACKNNQIYNVEEKICYEGNKEPSSDKVKRILGAAVGSAFSGLIVGLLVGLITMYLILKRFGQLNRNNSVMMSALEDVSSTDEDR
ncbi:uncharacterized protein LOC134270288 isoform X1 [Saccostrea cucullata]|uniref:uncharacterized protein LOC134270288 isoform X1 n=1 Tax=Saccostrea cuccullata TaxID=36930 RepID=UPI002ED4D5B1